MRYNKFFYNTGLTARIVRKTKKAVKFYKKGVISF